MSLTASLVQSAILMTWPWRRGRKKLVRWLARRTGEPFLYRGSDGIRYLLRGENYIDQRIARDGHYEGAAIDRLCREIDRRGIDALIDIGANLGVYTLAAARRCPGIDLIAFEPDPLNRAQLAANLFLNGLADRVRLQAEAVGAAAGHGLLHANRDPAWLSTGESSLLPPVRPAVTRAVPVPVVALDQVLAWRGRRIAIKLDIEGHEPAALAGMTRLCRDNLVLLQVEILPGRQDAVRAAIAALGLQERPQPVPGSHDYLFASPGWPEESPADRPPIALKA